MKQKLLWIVGGLIAGRFVWAWLSASGQLDNPHAIAGWDQAKLGDKLKWTWEVMTGKA